ncbi:MAG: shikimate dehydrogenase [Bacteroidetes bacterium]|nr:shikimate dehydrogenase [Bacteroidota bacterium]
MRRFGLIGYPLSHSFSPGFFSKKFEKEGLGHCRYDAFPLASIEELPDLPKKIPALEGLNVTIPYKEKVLPYLHRLSDEARSIGAVNVIKIRDGQLTGYNSDVYGFEKSLLDFLPSPYPAGLKALVLGTGGAAKAVGFVLKKTGIDFRLVSRSGQPDMLRYEEISEEIFHSHRLIVNTTPLGMSPDVNSCPPIPYEWTGPGHFFYDLVYNPEKTTFLARAEAAGSRIQNGLSMLYLQAEKAWEIWNNPEF